MAALLAEQLPVAGRQFFYGMTLERPTERKIYTLAEGMPRNGGIDLVFKTATEPFQELVSRRLYERVSVPEGPETYISWSERTLFTETEEDLTRIMAENLSVKRVFVNLNIASSFFGSTGLGCRLIKVISVLMRRSFPNIELRQSIVLVHTEFQTYIAKDEPGSQDIDNLWLIQR